jgi:hypothetical protein
MRAGEKAFARRAERRRRGSLKAARRAHRSMKVLLLAALVLLAPTALAAPSLADLAPATQLAIPCATAVDCAVRQFLCDLHPLHLCLL